MMRAFFNTATGSFWWAVGDSEFAYTATVVEVSGWPSEAHVYNGAEWVLPQEPPMTADAARAQRDDLLAATDWVVTKAVEQNAVDGLGIQVPLVWAEYRQALRDVPQQAGFPDNVIWPTAPE